MKFRKKIVCGLLVAAMAIGSSSVTCYAGDYGIKFSEKSYDAKYHTSASEKVKYINTYGPCGILIGKTQYTLARLRRKHTSGKNKGKIYKTKNKEYEDVIVVKMDAYPQQNKKYECYGVTEYIKCKVTLPKEITTINDYSPQNNPQQSDWNIGVNGEIGSDGGKLGVNASTTVKVKDLDVETNVNLPDRKAEFIFDYKPHKSLSWSSKANKYVRNSSTQYMMIAMNTKDYKEIKFDFNCNYTTAMSKKAEPCLTDWGSNKQKASYTWKLKK